MIMNAGLAAFAIIYTIASAHSLASECVAAPDGQCDTPRASGASLLQRELKGASLVAESPFKKDSHKGCNTMVDACATQTSDPALWFKSNWTAWKIGFGICCMSKYNPLLCDELDTTLFNFTDRNFSGGRLVKNTPDPQLEDFCTEADGLLTAHFGHETLDGDEVPAPSLLQRITSTATSSTILKKAVLNVGKTAGLKALFAKSSLHTRAQHAQNHISQCQEDTNCWAEVSSVQPWLLQLYERAKNIMEKPVCTKDIHDQAMAHCGKYNNDKDQCVQQCAGGLGCCSWHSAHSKCWPYCTVDKSDEGMCFPAGSRVALASTDVPVEELRRGAEVRSPEFGSDAGTSTAEFMIDNHAFEEGHATTITDFVKISHEFMRFGRPLMMTGDHLLFVQRPGEDHKPSWQLERADAVHEGDVVLSLDAVTNRTRPSTITGVDRVKARGAFAPLTTSGRLFVEGVAVSSLALSEESWRKAWDLASPEARTIWAERLLLTSILPSRILNYFGLEFDWLHKPQQAQLGKDVTKKVLETFFI
eukprot:TRINITY_DN5754_c0_g3_i1.p1 TRINITY_DN5754_c0_g3~~TRINITY_DN5754_c0_g3_i1.p1  ORF type:complete len:532 (-),score=86.59 TRINITY_DN5754_c0_g3_i1:213-1808(-)